MENAFACEGRFCSQKIEILESHVHPENQLCNCSDLTGRQPASRVGEIIVGSVYPDS